MNDYQHLIDELTTFAELDKEFIDPENSINTQAAKAIRQLVAERELDEQRVADLMVQLGDLAAERDKFAARRCEVCGYMEHHREHTGCLRKEVEKLTAERDAAFAMSRCECETNEACANLVKLHEQLALKESEIKNLKYYFSNVMETSYPGEKK